MLLLILSWNFYLKKKYSEIWKFLFYKSNKNILVNFYFNNLNFYTLLPYFNGSITSKLLRGEMKPEIWIENSIQYFSFRNSDKNYAN